MKNNTAMCRFLVLTLVFTAVFMHLFGIALLKWQMGQSFLYAYTLALHTTFLFDGEGLNTVFFTVTSFAAGALMAWCVGGILSLCQLALHTVLAYRSDKLWAEQDNVKYGVHHGRGNNP